MVAKHIFIIGALLLQFFSAQNNRCPDPEKESCISYDRERSSRAVPKCTGFGCPPCWTRRRGNWYCGEREASVCLGSNTFDIDRLDIECLARARPPQALDISLLN